MSNSSYHSSTHSHFYPRPSSSIPKHPLYDPNTHKPISNLYSNNPNNNSTNNNNISVYRPPSATRFQTPLFTSSKPIQPPYKQSPQKQHQHQQQRRSASLYQDVPSTSNMHINKSSNNNNSSNTSNHSNVLSQSPSKSLNDKYFSPIYSNINSLNLSKQFNVVQQFQQGMNDTYLGGSSSNDLSNSKSSHNNSNSNNVHHHQQQQHQTFFLPPKNKKYPKKTLILDLDETLVHSSFKPFPFKPDISLHIVVDTRTHNVNVLKRPFVNEFLSRMALFYELVIFTASVAPYANPLLDILDNHKVISHRLFRQHCVNTSGLYIKNLRKVGRDMKNMIILDNNPISYVFNKENGVPIPTWKSDRNDKELLKIMPFLEYLSKVDDVRNIVKQVVKNNSIDYNEVNKLIQSDNSSSNSNKNYNKHRGDGSYNNSNNIKDTSKLKRQDVHNRQHSNNSNSNSNNASLKSHSHNKESKSHTTQNSNNININIVNQFVSNVYLNENNNNSNHKEHSNNNIYHYSHLQKTHQDIPHTNNNNINNTNTQLNIYRSSLVGADRDKDRERERDKKGYYFYYNKNNDNKPITINNNNNHNNNAINSSMQHMHNNQFIPTHTPTSKPTSASFLSQSYAPSNHHHRDTTPPKSDINFYHPSPPSPSSLVNQFIPSYQAMSNYPNYTRIVQDPRNVIDTANRDRINSYTIQRPSSKSFYLQERENNLNFASRNQRYHTPLRNSSQINNNIINEMGSHSFINNNNNISNIPQGKEFNYKRPVRNASSMTVRRNQYYQIAGGMMYNPI